MKDIQTSELVNGGHGHQCCEGRCVHMAILLRQDYGGTTQGAMEGKWYAPPKACQTLAFLRERELP